MADQLINLAPASDMRAVADAAVEDLEEISCAYAINSAANTGCHSTYYDHPISKQLQAKLKSLGYDVFQDKSAADPSKRWIIQGF